jgi:hypothetical protein
MSETSSPLTPEQAEALALVRQHGSIRAAIRASGWPRTTLRKRYARACRAEAGEGPGKPFEVQAPATSPDVPVQELIDRLCRDYRRKAEHAEANRIVGVDIKVNGPVGLLVFGDPHLDSPLTNWPAVMRDIGLVNKTEALFGVNLGDTVDNWGGKLAHLAANNGVTQHDASRLAHWFIGEVDWLLFLLGNHCWMRDGGSLIRWMSERAGHLAADWSQRLALRFPNGREVRVNHKHGFNGNSIWHPNHGQLREMRFGARDHLYTGGHIHQAGIMGPIVDQTSGDWMIALQVGAYKDLSDTYGKRIGSGMQNAFPSAVVVINPEATKPSGLLHIFPDTEEGADYLGFARKRWAQGKRAAA